MPERADAHPTLSVVVPIYGVEKWLPAFLDSLIAQTFSDWEAILVIDGSPDGCLEIAQSYAAQDRRLRVHSFENGGLGRARNRGLRLALGTYVTFPDSDDVLAENAYGLLVESLLASGSDIATAVGEDFYEDGRRTIYWAQKSELFAQKRIGINLAGEPRLVLDHIAWNKVFRTSLLRDNHIEYPEDTLCEDVVHSLKAMLCAGSVDVLPDVVYAHRRREFAITSDTMGDRVVDDWVQQTQDAMKIVTQEGDTVLQDVYFRRLISLEVWNRVRNFDRVDDEERLLRIEHLVAHIYEQVPDMFATLPPIKHRVLRFVADNGVSKRWRAPRLELNPLSDQLESGLQSYEASLLAIRSFDFTIQHEVELAVALLRDLTLGPLFRLDQLADEQIESVATLIQASRPAIDAVLLSAVLTPLEHILLTTFLAGEHDRAAEILALGRAPFSAAFERFETYGAGVLLIGRATVGSTVTDGDRFELVLRSESSKKVRTLRVQMQKVPGQEDQFRWRAVMPVSGEFLEETWRVWTRILHRSGARIESRVEMGRKLEGPNTLVISGADVAVFAFGAPHLTFATYLTASSAEVLDALPEPERASLPDEDQSEQASRLLVFPHWNGNPFLNILYLAPRAQGTTIIRSVHLDDLVIQLERLRRHDVFHMHWTRPVCQDATSEADACDRLARFKKAITAAKSAGVVIVWTVHNALAHDAVYLDLEIELHRFLAGSADLIHILAPGTREIVADLYELPLEKIVHIAHPSYQGVYGAPTPRLEARGQFDIAEAEQAVLFFGRMKPYKGLANLFRAVDDIDAQKRNIVLMLAGHAHEDERLALESQLPSSTRLIRDHGFIENDVVGEWFSAADIAVFPYERILNSGSVHLAATYGVPCVLPNEPHLVDQFGDQAWVHFFDRNDPVNSIAQVLAEWDDSSGQESRSAFEFARSFTPYMMSTEFAARLDLFLNERGALR